MRTIKVYSTRTGTTTPVQTDVQTFGELKTVLAENDIEYNSAMKAIESVNNTSLELDNSKLPEGDFILGIFPRKTKAGSLRNDLYGRIKEFVQRDGKDKVNQFFTDKTGRHYTNVATDELEQLVEQYDTEEVTYSTLEEKLRACGVDESIIEKVVNESARTEQEVWAEAVCEQHPDIDC